MKEIFNFLGINIIYVVLYLVMANTLVKVYKINNHLVGLIVYACASISALWICIKLDNKITIHDQ